MPAKTAALALLLLIGCSGHRADPNGHTSLKTLKERQAAYELWVKCQNSKPKYGAREVYVRHNGTLVRCRN